MFLINGHKQESLAVSDRATQFGDGCFTYIPPATYYDRNH